jgi:aminoglycoside phosphotransferase
MKSFGLRVLNWLAGRYHKAAIYVLLQLKRTKLNKLIRNAAQASEKDPVVWRVCGGGMCSYSYNIQVKTKIGDIDLFLKIASLKLQNHVALKLLSREARALSELKGSCHAPELKAFDRGSILGVPFLLAEKLTGRPRFDPEFLAKSTSQVAEVLARIHERPVDENCSVLHEWKPLASPGIIPPWATSLEMWERARALMGQSMHLPIADRVFSHGDFGPHNLLWSSENLTGVIDWPTVMCLAREWDVASYRLALAAICGLQVADKFTNEYKNITNRELPFLEIYDLYHLFRIDYPKMEPAGYEYWKHHIVRPQMHARLNDFVAISIKKIDSSDAL